LQVVVEDEGEEVRGELGARGEALDLCLWDGEVQLDLREEWGGRKVVGWESYFIALGEGLTIFMICFMVQAKLLNCLF
jgi:hypothetical protein